MHDVDLLHGSWHVTHRKLKERLANRNDGTPIPGSFTGGVGTFYADDTLRGKPVHVKTTWSRITPTSARWEQSYSGDGGKTYALNWTSDFQRAP